MAVKRYNGSSWDTVAGLGAQGAAAQSSSITTWVKTATGGETSLTGSSDSSTTLAYTPGQEQFFINGVLQVRGSDYTATNGTSITGITALVAGDIATVTTVNAFSVTGAVPLSTVTANGDLIVGTSSGAVGRLGIGSTGNLLTVAGGVPTWAAPPAAGSMTLISTTALTGSSITLSSIPQTYKSLVLYITGHYPSTNNALFRMRVNGSSSSVYDGAGEQSNATLEYLNQDHVKLGVYGQASSGTDFQKNHVAMTIPNYTTSTVYKVLDFLQIWRTGETTPRAMFESIAWAFKDTTAITSLEFSYSTGNIGGGSVQLYGVN